MELILGMEMLMDLLGETGPMIPLLGTLMAIPTREEARARELQIPRPVLIEPGELWSRFPELTLTENGLREGKWWTLLSHMFIHENPNHLCHNLMTILISGRAVCHGLGPAGFYCVFFATGAIAGANRRGRLSQVEAQLEGQLSMPRSISEWMPETVQSLVDRGSAFVARSSAGMVNELHQHIGASSGACGLMGFGMGLLARDLLGAGEVEAVRGSGLGRLFSLLRIADCLVFAMKEWQDYRGCNGLTGIAHSAHLTGLVSGLALAGLWILVDDSHDEPRRPPPRHGVNRRQARSGRYVDEAGELH